ncbi:cytochrome c peroxidase [Bradyrhizobium sp. LB7.2]
MKRGSTLRRADRAFCDRCHNGSPPLGEAAHIQPRFHLRNVSGHRSSGSTYYATMTVKNSGKLHVEACALGHFWCSGNDWTRAEEQSEKLITTSRQWSARS